MSWEIDFDDQSSFVQASFQDYDDIGFQDSAQEFTAAPIASQNTPTITPSASVPCFKPSEPAPQERIAPTGQSLIDENNLLRESFISLRQKADQVEHINIKLKSQLDECRSWFKQAMFYGVAHGSSGKN